MLTSDVRAFLASLLLCGVAQIAVSAQTARSEKYTWKSVNVIAGGYVPGIVFSPKQPGLAYCRTDIGGFYKWESSTKQWTPLGDWCGVSNYMGGESIAPDPVDANKVYLACGMYSSGPAAIMRSKDQGKTFDVIKVPFTMGGNENGRGVGERLAIDPNSPEILYFGSRHDGLWVSTDSATTWCKVDSFPIQGSGRQSRGGGFGGGGGAVGLSFVVFDPSGGTAGSASRMIYVGSTEPGDSHLFRSSDAGKTWQPVPGQPANTLMPIHAEVDGNGVLYLAYGNGPGPNGVTDGAVWKLNTREGIWTDITPLPPGRDGNRRFGYGGLSLDRQHPGTLVVTTIDRWSPIDDVLRSTDGGKSWKSINAKARMDISRSPFLTFGAPAPKFGWWMDALAIDPFDSNRAAYGTGATIYGTNDLTMADADQPTHWSVWAEGMEETAIINLTSPTEGAHLISAFGDIGGFTHDDLAISPASGMHKNPAFGNTNTVDYAERNPKVIVRTGTGNARGSGMAYSEDGGHTWQPLARPAGGGQGGRGGGGRGGGGLIVSADGSAFMTLGATPAITRDRGKTWTSCQGLPEGVRPVADRFNAAKFYAVDVASKQVHTSTDGGTTFKATPCKLPDLPAGGGGRGGGFGGGRGGSL